MSNVCPTCDLYLEDCLCSSKNEKFKSFLDDREQFYLDQRLEQIGLVEKSGNYTVSELRVLEENISDPKENMKSYRSAWERLDDEDDGRDYSWQLVVECDEQKACELRYLGAMVNHDDTRAVLTKPCKTLDGNDKFEPEVYRDGYFDFVRKGDLVEVVLNVWVSPDGTKVRPELDQINIQ